MIQIIGTQISEHELVLHTSEKVQGKIQTTTVRTIGDMDRLYYFWTRLYIIERLCAFLRQRIKAFQIAGFRDYEQSAIALLSVFENYRLTSLFKLCRIVADAESTIKALSPTEKSKHFKYYNETILSIINFCKNEQQRNGQPVEHAA